MRIVLLILPVLVLVCSCSKDSKPEGIKRSPAELLTQKQWLLTTAGFDDNGNGLVDNGEDILSACQKDDIYTFNIQGHGSINDQGLRCDPPSFPDFSWKFLGDDASLEIGFQKYFIVRLTETELALSPDLPFDSKFVMVYRH